MSSPALVVLESVPVPRPTTNPYLVQVLRSMPPDVTARTFSWRTALTGHYDVFHVHWPENLARGSTRPRTAARRLALAALLARLTLTRTPIVRTLHNSTPHEGSGRIERALLRGVDRRTALWIRLGDTVPAPGPAVTIAHGHYRDWYREYEVPPREPGRILFVGLIRPYKGVEDLLEAFAGVRQDVGLRIVGRPTEAALGEAVARAAAADPRVSALLEYVDDATMAREMGRAQVVVLPYRRLENSGAALLALSFARPVLLPEGPVAEALAAEVGSQWVGTFSGPLTAADLEGAVTAAAGIAPDDAPDLGGRDWGASGDAHAAAFRRAVDLARG